MGDSDISDNRPSYRLPLTGPFPSSLVLPVSEAAKQRNTMLDSTFYDVGALSAAEMARLVRETNIEGSILVVHPRGAKGDVSITKFEGYDALRSAPGALLRNFTIAGVGSSDVGAAALARGLADFLDEPVGAIVAGYGVSDVLAEALGGWFFFGTINRALKASQTAMGVSSEAGDAAGPNGRMNGLTGISPDTDSLVRLLHDEDREIATILGHSKGCLSMATALDIVGRAGSPETVEKAKAVRAVTTGAVVEFPQGFDNVHQFLGGLDWFGAMNSRLGNDFTPVPNAWHHVNSALPFHMDLPTVLAKVH